MSVDPVTGVVVSPRRWSAQPVAAGLTVGLLTVAGLQARVMDETPWPVAGWAALGIVAALVAAGMLAAGWWRHSPDWTRRGYFMAATVYAAWALIVGHAEGPLAEVGLSAALAVVAVLSWRAEVEARWLSRPRS